MLVWMLLKFIGDRSHISLAHLYRNKISDVCLMTGERPLSASMLQLIADNSEIKFMTLDLKTFKANENLIQKINDEKEKKKKEKSDYFEVKSKSKGVKESITYLFNSELKHDDIVNNIKKYISSFNNIKRELNEYQINTTQIEKQIEGQIKQKINTHDFKSLLDTSHNTIAIEILLEILDIVKELDKYSKFLDKCYLIDILGKTINVDIEDNKHQNVWKILSSFFIPVSKPIGRKEVFVDKWNLKNNNDNKDSFLQKLLYFSYGDLFSFAKKHFKKQDLHYLNIIKDCAETISYFKQIIDDVNSYFINNNNVNNNLIINNKLENFKNIMRLKNY